MNNAKINNAINLTYPDGFVDMDEEALTRYFGSPKDRWGVYDEKNHIILSVGWTKVTFWKKLTDAESVLMGAEFRLSRNLLNYQRITSYKLKIGGKKVKGYAIRFEYRVNDAKLVQVADAVSFKYKNHFYMIYFISRKSNAGSSRTAFDETLKSITLD